MKILIVTPYYDEPHRWVASSYKAASALARQGHEVVVLTSGRARAVEEPSPRLKVYRFRDVFFPDPVNFGIMPFLSLRLRSVLRTESPSHVLVYKHMFYTSLSVLWLKLWRRPVVLVTDTFPGVIWFSRSRAVNAVLWLYARTVGLAVLKLADRVVLLHAGLVEVSRRLGLRSVTVVENGVDTDVFRDPDLPRDVPRADGDIVVTYVGRLESVKGVDLLLSVAAELCEKRPNVRVLMVGAVPPGTSLESRFRHDRIHFLGFRSDVPGILAMTDIFVLPSYAEGLPNALMEAMAAGCACVASRVGGVVALLGADDAGITVPAGEAEPLRLSIERLLDDPELRRKLGSRAREVIRDRFSLDRSATRLGEVLEEVRRESRRER